METAVSDYITSTKRMSEIERLSTVRAKTGVFTGAVARHPLTGADIPIWVADYVLPGYGSGAVMGVPAHDERDYAFAQTYDLPIIPVVQPENGVVDGECFTGMGVMINSGPYTGMGSEDGGAQVVADLAAQGAGQAQVSYKMRDWLISRQRYWGAPIPIVHCPTCGAVPCRKPTCPCCCRTWTILPQRATAVLPWPVLQNGCTPSAHSAAARRSAKPTPWTALSALPGTSCALPAHTLPVAPSNRKRWRSGCR